jgi:hypothetical protein
VGSNPTPSAISSLDVKRYIIELNRIQPIIPNEQIKHRFIQACSNQFVAIPENRGRIGQSQ